MIRNGEPSTTACDVLDKGADYCELAALGGEVSDDLLWMSSQQTSYSECEDISELIMAVPLGTQPATEEKPPTSATPSASSLGKRKASDFSSDSSFQGPYRHKFLKPTTSDDNLFDVSSAASKPVIQGPDTPIVVSFNVHLQRCFDSRKLPYGVQYEIARLVSNSRLNFDEITIEKLDVLAKLRSNSRAAPVTAKVLLRDGFEGDAEDAWTTSFAKEIAARTPWEELDKEEEALMESPFGGLGVDDRRPNWHGGQVHFRSTLKDKSQKGTEPEYDFVLERAELGPSDHFARRFGSKHFLRVKISKNVLNKNSGHLLEYFRRPFVVCGCVFRAFFAKDSNVFLFKTNESYENGLVVSPKHSTPGSLSLLEFIQWHNNLELNKKQTMAKWASRFTLGLSNSAPGVKLDLTNIKMTTDIVSTAGSDMTDGAATINRAGLLSLKHKFNWEERPSAIQVRIWGAKGLLVEDSSDKSEEPRITLRKSQIKINYPSHSPPDPTHLIIDVLRSSHGKTPCRLSVETIINLAENMVPKESFLKLLQQGLNELVEPLLAWEGPKAMHALWCTLRRMGGVMPARRAREDVGLARVKGFSERDNEETELEDEDGLQELDIIEQRSSAWWGDEVSGSPSSLEETVMYMIDAGFTPLNSAVLRSKLEKIVKHSIKNYIKNYRIDVPMSATAFIVPDELGVLEPGEIFYKHPVRHLRTPDDLETDILLGDVLVTRHPCKLPTDVQKWKAVDKPELHYLTGVIVFSIKGDRRAADLLAGGDYDGDKALVIWQPELVDPFIPASLEFSKPPAGIEEKNFSQVNESVVDFLTRTELKEEKDKIRELQWHLLGAIREIPVVGKYSTFHENAIYTLGYKDKETIRLAYMFCMTLDGSKTGLTVLPEVLKADGKKYQHRAPVWKETEEEKERLAQQGRNDVNLKRPKRLGFFIMDRLHDQAEAEGSARLAQIETVFASASRIKLDADLTAPWLNARKRSERWLAEEGNSRMKQELDQIKTHVQKVYEEHRSEVRGGSPTKSTRFSPRKKVAFTELPIEVRQDKFRAISKKFASFPSPGAFFMSDEEVATIRASYAYSYDAEMKGGYGYTRFPWDVAMRDLATIKARATGRHKTVSGDFYDEFNMKHPRKHHI